jgi:hypothetical protein
MWNWPNCLCPRAAVTDGSTETCTVTAVWPPSMSPRLAHVSVSPVAGLPLTVGAGPAVVETYVKPGCIVSVAAPSPTALLAPTLTTLALRSPVPFCGKFAGLSLSSSLATALPLKKSEL